MIRLLALAALLFPALAFAQTPTPEPIEIAWNVIHIAGGSPTAAAASNCDAAADYCLDFEEAESGGECVAEGGSVTAGSDSDCDYTTTVLEGSHSFWLDSTATPAIQTVQFLNKLTPTEGVDTVTVKFLFRPISNGASTAEGWIVQINDPSPVTPAIVITARDADADGNFTIILYASQEGGFKSVSDSSDTVASGTTYCIQATQNLADDSIQLWIDSTTASTTADCGTTSIGTNSTSTATGIDMDDVYFKSSVSNSIEYVIDVFEVSW